MRAWLIQANHAMMRACQQNTQNTVQVQRASTTPAFSLQVLFKYYKKQPDSYYLPNPLCLSLIGQKYRYYIIVAFLLIEDVE
jgi:hypothetical protein